MKKILLFLLLVISTQSSRVTVLKEKAQDSLFLNETYSDGFIDIQAKGKMFYLLFHSRNNPEKDPLVIFFTGGEGGGSSLMACFQENGPLMLQAHDGTLKINPYSWNNKANLMYVEQPLGIGFSEVENDDGYSRTLDEIAMNFYEFLEAFYAQYPEFNRRKLYLVGEQFGGRWAAIIGSYIIKKGKNKFINLAGVGLGDAWIYPYVQFTSHGEFAVRNKIVTDDEHFQLAKEIETCIMEIQKNDFVPAIEACFALKDSFIGKEKKFNPYNFKLPCKVEPFCYDFSPLNTFINSEQLQNVLGLNNKQWSVFSKKSYDAIFPTYLEDVSKKVIDILDKGIPVLVYHGENDFDVDWYGAKSWLVNLRWGGRREFSGTSYQDASDYGYIMKYEPLMFFRVKNAGQLVPMDRPEAGEHLLLELFNCKKIIRVASDEL